MGGVAAIVPHSLTSRRFKMPTLPRGMKIWEDGKRCRTKEFSAYLEEVFRKGGFQPWQELRDYADEVWRKSPAAKLERRERAVRRAKAGVSSVKMRFKEFQEPALTLAKAKLAKAERAVRKAKREVQEEKIAARFSK